MIVISFLKTRGFESTREILILVCWSKKQEFVSIANLPKKYP